MGEQTHIDLIFVSQPFLYLNIKYNFLEMCVLADSCSTNTVMLENNII